MRGKLTDEIIRKHIFPVALEYPRSMKYVRLVLMNNDNTVKFNRKWLGFFIAVLEQCRESLRRGKVLPLGRPAASYTSNISEPGKLSRKPLRQKKNDNPARRKQCRSSGL